MAGSIKHRHQTAVATSGADVDKNEWNDSEVVAGGTDGQYFQRDSSQPDGWKLMTLLSRGTFASRGAADGKQGLYLSTDGFALARDNGVSFDTMGPNFAFTPPTDPGNWDNQGSSSISLTKDSLILTGAGTGNAENLVVRYAAAPATPWTWTVYTLAMGFSKNNSYGLCFREAATGKITTFEYFLTNGNSVPVLRRSKYTNSTTKSADYANVANHAMTPVWFRISDNGTNLICYTSADGQNWVTFHTIARTDFFTTAPDQYGIFVNTQNASTPNLAPIMTVLHSTF